MQLQLGLRWSLTPALVPRTAESLTSRFVPLLEKVLYEGGALGGSSHWGRNGEQALPPLQSWTI